MVQQSKFAQVFDAKLEKVDSAMSAINGIVWAEAQLGMRLKRARNQRDLIVAHQERLRQDYDLYTTVHLDRATEDEDWQQELVRRLNEEVIARLREMLEVVAEMPDYGDEPQDVQDRIDNGYDDIVDILDELRRMG